MNDQICGFRGGGAFRIDVQISVSKPLYKIEKTFQFKSFEINLQPWYERVTVNNLWIFSVELKGLEWVKVAIFESSLRCRRSDLHVQTVVTNRQNVKVQQFENLVRAPISETNCKLSLIFSLSIELAANVSSWDFRLSLSTSPLKSACCNRCKWSRKFHCFNKRQYLRKPRYQSGCEFS